MDQSNDMQNAYQEFMLRGTQMKSGSATATPSPASKKPQTTPSSSSSKQIRGSTRKKGYRPIFKAFQGRLQDWKDTNDQLEKVMHSIVNLRDRIDWQSSHLLMLAAAAQERPRQPWQGCGFRSASVAALTVEDIHLALDHDLLQHERMLAHLRSLIASLAQTLDAIGRRLDEWLLQDIDLTQMLQLQSLQIMDSTIEESRILEEARHLYSLLAQDLFRKQRAVQLVLESCHDGLVEKDSNKSHMAGNPRDAVKQSVKEWPYPPTMGLLVDRLLSTP